MNENLRSILTGAAGLSDEALVALLLTILRKPVDGDLAGRERTVRVFLIGLAAQCLHFAEKFLTPESRANRTLLSSVWAAAAVPASVLTAARKLKYSWILARLPGLDPEEPAPCWSLLCSGITWIPRYFGT